MVFFSGYSFAQIEYIELFWRKKNCSTSYHFDRSKALQLCSIGHHELTESSSKTSGSSFGEGKKHAFQSGGIFITIVNVVQIIPFRQSNDKSFI